MRLKMAGLDQVPVTDDSKRAQVGNAQTIHESEMALFYECIQKCARNVLDSANPVRDGGFSPNGLSFYGENPCSNHVSCYNLG